jgi:transcriptional regulator with XRE-family HTH domain
MLDRELLARLTAQGLTIRAMADELGVSPTTIRRRLRKYGLETPRTRRLRETAPARAQGTRTTVAYCPRHGRGTFTKSPTGGFRCLLCRNEAVSRRRRAVKEALVAEAGGACALCGYARSTAALQFHHVTPILKAFGISERGVSRALSKAREEAEKCILLCANCHAEVEAGLATLPEKLST